MEKGKRGATELRHTHTHTHYGLSTELPTTELHDPRPGRTSENVALRNQSAKKSMKSGQEPPGFGLGSNFQTFRLVSMIGPTSPSARTQDV